MDRRVRRLSNLKGCRIKSVKVLPTSKEGFNGDQMMVNGRLYIKDKSRWIDVASQSQVRNTLYAYFGVTSTMGIPNGSGTHYAVPFNMYYSSSAFITLGTTTASPDSSVAISSTADDMLVYMWYIPDNIKIQNIDVWIGGNASGGDSILLHLMSYDVVRTDGATCGNLSNGVVVADGAAISHDGYEQTDYQSMTIQNGNVDSGKAVFLTLHADGTNSDYAVNAIVKYNLR